MATSERRIIYCTVTNDLNYDQRMIRICSSLVRAGYEVHLVGRERKASPALQVQIFEQHRLRCWWEKGKLFYVEFNIRLWWWLLWRRWDAVCSVDLDTILAGFYASKWRGKPCIYDAHEYFTEVPEVVERPRVKRVWEWVAARTIPHIRYAYTVGEGLAGLFEQRYATRFEVVRNVPFKYNDDLQIIENEKFTLLYQGALNDGRGLEELIEAMRELPLCRLWIAGEGDLSAMLRERVQRLGLADRVEFLGYVSPVALKQKTLECDLGINLLKNKGLNYYYSLANKFFDYIQAEKPSLNMAFPEYSAICASYEVGILLPNLDVSGIVAAVQRLQLDKNYYEHLKNECRKARQIYVWEREEQTLLGVYERVFSEHQTK